jgi:hypothetical protein
MAQNTKHRCRWHVIGLKPDTVNELLMAKSYSEAVLQQLRFGPAFLKRGAANGMGLDHHRILPIASQ